MTNRRLASRRAPRSRDPAITGPRGAPAAPAPSTSNARPPATPGARRGAGPPPPRHRDLWAALRDGRASDEHEHGERHRHELGDEQRHELTDQGLAVVDLFGDLGQRAVDAGLGRRTDGCDGCARLGE